MPFPDGGFIPVTRHVEAWRPLRARGLLEDGIEFPHDRAEPPKHNQRHPLATRVMSNGVEVIVADGGMTQEVGVSRSKLLRGLPSRPLSLAPSTLDDNVRMTVKAPEAQARNNITRQQPLLFLSSSTSTALDRHTARHPVIQLKHNFIIKTCYTTFTYGYLTTLLHQSRTVVSTYETVVSTVTTEPYTPPPMSVFEKMTKTDKPQIDMFQATKSVHNPADFSKIEKRIDDLQSLSDNDDLIQPSEVSPSANSCSMSSCPCTVTLTESLKDQKTKIVNGHSNGEDVPLQLKRSPMKPTKYGSTIMDIDPTPVVDNKNTKSDKVASDVTNDDSKKTDRNKTGNKNNLKESENFNNKGNSTRVTDDKRKPAAEQGDKNKETQKPQKTKFQVADLLKLGTLGIKKLAPMIEQMTGTLKRRQELNKQATTIKPAKVLTPYIVNKRIDSIDTVPADHKSSKFPIYIPVDEMDLETAESQNGYTNSTLHQNLVWASQNLKNSRNNIGYGKPIHESPLLNGGIPISPGEIITANSDVIVGKPAVGGPNIGQMGTHNNNGHSNAEPNFHDSNSQSSSFQDIRAHPPQRGQGLKHIPFIRDETYDLTPPGMPQTRPSFSPISNMKQQQPNIPPLLGPFKALNNNQNSQTRPNTHFQYEVVKSENVPYKNQPPPTIETVNEDNKPHNTYVGHVGGSIHPPIHIENHGRPAFLDYIPSLGSPTSYQNYIRNNLITRKNHEDSVSLNHLEISRPTPSKTWTADNKVIPLNIGESLYKPVKDAPEPILLTDIVVKTTPKPFLVDIQPSRVANVIIPHGSTTALIFSGSSEPHKNGEYIDDPLPYQEPGYFGSFSIDAPHLTAIHVGGTVPLKQNPGHIDHQQRHPQPNEQRVQQNNYNSQGHIPEPQVVNHGVSGLNQDVKPPPGHRWKYEDTAHGKQPPKSFREQISHGSNLHIGIQESHGEFGQNQVKKVNMNFGPDVNVPPPMTNQYFNAGPKNVKTSTADYEADLAVPPPPPPTVQVKYESNVGVLNSQYEKFKNGASPNIGEHLPESHSMNSGQGFPLRQPYPTQSNENVPPRITSEVYFASTASQGEYGQKLNSYNLNIPATNNFNYRPQNNQQNSASSQNVHFPADSTKFINTFDGGLVTLNAGTKVNIPNVPAPSNANIRNKNQGVIGSQYTIPQAGGLITLNAGASVHGTHFPEQTISGTSVNVPVSQQQGNSQHFNYQHIKEFSSHEGESTGIPIGTNFAIKVEPQVIHSYIQNNNVQVGVPSGTIPKEKGPEIIVGGNSWTAGVSGDSSNSFEESNGNVGGIPDSVHNGNEKIHVVHASSVNEYNRTNIQSHVKETNQDFNGFVNSNAKFPLANDNKNNVFDNTHKIQETINKPMPNVQPKQETRNATSAQRPIIVSNKIPESSNKQSNVRISVSQNQLYLAYPTSDTKSETTTRKNIPLRFDYEIDNHNRYNQNSGFGNNVQPADFPQIDSNNWQQSSGPKPTETQNNQQRPRPTEKQNNQQRPRPTETQNSQQRPRPTETQNSQQRPRPTETQNNQQRLRPTETQNNQQRPRPVETQNNQYRPKPTETQNNQRKPSPFVTQNNHQRLKPEETLKLNENNNRVNGFQKQNSPTLTTQGYNPAYILANYNNNRQPVYDIPIREEPYVLTKTTARPVEASKQTTKTTYDKYRPNNANKNDGEYLSLNTGEYTQESMKVPVLSSTPNILSNEVTVNYKPFKNISYSQDEILLGSENDYYGTDKKKPAFNADDNSGSQTEQPFDENRYKEISLVTLPVVRPTNPPIYNGLFNQMSPRPFTVNDANKENSAFNAKPELPRPRPFQKQPQNADGLNIGEVPAKSTTTEGYRQPSPTYKQRLPQAFIKNDSIYKKETDKIITSSVNLATNKPIRVVNITTDKTPSTISIHDIEITTKEENNTMIIPNLSPPPPTMDYSFKPTGNDETIMGMNPPPKTPAPKPNKEYTKYNEISTYRPSYNVLKNQYRRPSDFYRITSRPFTRYTTGSVIRTKPTPGTRIVFPSRSSSWSTPGRGETKASSINPSVQVIDPSKISITSVIKTAPTTVDSVIMHPEIYPEEVVGIVEPSVNTIQSSVNTFQSSIDPFQSSVNPFQSSVIPIQSSVNPFQSSINPIPSSVNPFQSSVNPIPSSVNPFRSSVNPILSSVNPIQSSINPIKSSVNPIQSSIIESNAILPERVQPSRIYPTAVQMPGQSMLAPTIISAPSVVYRPTVIQSSEKFFNENAVKEEETIKPAPTMSLDDGLKKPIKTLIHKFTVPSVQTQQNTIINEMTIKPVHHAGNEIQQSDDYLEKRPEKVTVITYTTTLAEPASTVMTTRFVTLVHTLTVTQTKTSLISQVVGSRVQTLVLTNTQTSTVVDVVTEIHTLVQPTTIVTTITKHIPTLPDWETKYPKVPIEATHVQEMPLKTKEVHLDDVSLSSDEEDLIITPDETSFDEVALNSNNTSSQEDNDTFFVVMNKSQNGGSGPSISPPLDSGDLDGVTRNEEVGNDGVSHVLLGEILLAGTPFLETSQGVKPPGNGYGKDCQPECQASRNERCQRTHGLMRCVCRPGFARMFPDRPCKPTYTYSMKLALSRYGQERLAYQDALSDPGSQAFQTLAQAAHQGINRMVMQSDLRDVYHGVHVNGFHPVTIPSKEGTYTGVVNDFFVQLSDNAHETRLKEVMEKYLRTNNYSLGGTEVYAAGELVDKLEVGDFNECTSVQFHDCSEHAECFNLRASYTCSCREGYADLSPNPLYPGRMCSAEAVGCERCHYHGTCYNRDDSVLCECFQWYAGDTCQVNLKVILISLSTLGALLLLVLLVCLVLGCARRRRSRPGPMMAACLAPHQGSSVQSSKHHPTLDKRALIQERGNDSGGEGSSVHNISLPYIPAKKTSQISQKSSKRLSLQENQEKGKPFTLMIPRAKYCPGPTAVPLSDSRDNGISGKRKFSGGDMSNETKLLSYLDGGLGSNDHIARIDRKQSNESAYSLNKSGHHKYSTGALVSAGFKVSTTVTEESRVEMKEIPDDDSSITKSHTLGTLDMQSQFNSLRKAYSQEDLNDWTDAERRIGELTMSEARSFDGTLVKPATKMMRSTTGSNKSSAHYTQHEANTMAERDLGSTFLLPHVHLYKPDMGSDVSEFDSL